MENCCMEIPTWDECKRRLDNEKFCKDNGHTQIEEEKPNELHRFVYEESPAGKEEQGFRDRLARLINFLVIG